ncbi:MAG: DUF948 domain-containing protein [Nitrospirota bacterium]|jgi:uncharacterized protein YoxC
MTETILVIIAVLVALGVGFLIATLFELKRTVSQTAQFLRNTETSVNAAFKEMEETLKSIRAITDDIGAVSGDLKRFSSSLTLVARNLRELGEMMGDLSTEASLRVAGIKVGVRTALDVLVRNILRR